MLARTPLTLHVPPCAEPHRGRGRAVGRVLRRRSDVPLGSLLAILAGVAAPAGLFSAEAAERGLLASIDWIDARTVTGSAVIMGVLIFATVLAIVYLRERRAWTILEGALRGEIARRRGGDDLAALLLGAERQVVIVWADLDAEPTIEGDPTIAAETASLGRVLAFGSWLAGPDAGRLEAAVATLRERGEAFGLTLARLQGGFVDADGRTVSGRAMLRLRDSSDDRSALMRSQSELERATRQLGGFRGLLEAVDDPAWIRDRSGRITWSNGAYQRAVGAAPDGSASELLDAESRRAAESRRQEGSSFQTRAAAIVDGRRRLLDIAEVSLPDGAGGLAHDVSEIEAARGAVDRRTSSQTRLLDLIPTAVAIFDADQRLSYHNAAYARLWGLDAAFLASRPSDGEILDRLRASRLLPEQADYRAWKAGLLDAYRATAGSDTFWHLPDRRSLRVVTHPAREGGLTYLFDDVSGGMQLESRVNALTQTQRETLDTLAEGVALFGSDGRLRLFNRALVDLWRLDRAALEASPHIDAVVELCRPFSPDETPWNDLREAVAGLSEMRTRTTTRLERADGTSLDCAAEPLPDGATLLTFADVTATVNVERALTDRNNALETAGRIRDEFVHHVSYELRSPLTTVIGFAELLGAETVGPLNERQREYAGHITRSSGALLAIINDILDLASIDTETIVLTRERVDVRRVIEAASVGIEDRLVEAELRLVLDIPGDIGSFTADEKRVRQIVYNLLSNAASFSSRGQAIRVAARKHVDEVVISVSDQGAGIPQHVQSRVFDRFESQPPANGRRGVGLGLSIVRSFVELHGGHVELVSERGSGTTVTCYFPADGEPSRQLAAELPPEERP